MTIIFPVDLMILFGGPLVLISDGLFDVGYQYAVLMNNLYIFAQVVGSLFFLYLAKTFGFHRILPFQHVLFERKDLRRSSFFFLIIFLSALFVLANAELGFFNWLLNPRQGYQLYRAGQGHWYALAVSALSVSYVLALLAKPTAGNVIFCTVFYMCFGFFLGSKSGLLSIFTTALIFLWFLRWHHLDKIYLFGIPILFGLMLFNLSLAIDDSFEFQNVLMYFDHYKNGADYYRSYLSGEVSLFHGEILSSSLWAYVPRAIWPDKPWIYGVINIVEMFYPGLAETGNTPAFGGAVEQFADFGPLGVVLFGFFSTKAILTGVLSHLIFRKPGLSFVNVTLASLILILVQYAPSFGAYFASGLYLILLLATLFVLSLLKTLRKRVTC